VSDGAISSPPIEMDLPESTDMDEPELIVKV
jgi:hypothetical protein